LSETEEWQLMHVLKGHVKSCHCAGRCGDPVCQAGCLQQSAKVFRGDIMHGIQISRDNGESTYPISAASMSGSLECTGQCAKDNVIASHRTPAQTHICADAVCHISGCMDVPAWKFRDLIQMAVREELMKALK